MGLLRKTINIKQQKKFLQPIRSKLMLECKSYDMLECNKSYIVLLSLLGGDNGVYALRVVGDIGLKKMRHEPILNHTKFTALHKH